MDHGHGTVLELTLVLLIAALAIVPLAQKLRLSPVVGYLAAGIAIGPHGLGFVPDDSFVEVLAEFGIAFLLFTLGLELSIERLRTMRKQIFGLGSAQVIVTAILFALFNVALGVDLEAAIIIGTALALSSTAVVLQVLAERGELVGRSGRAARVTGSGTTSSPGSPRPALRPPSSRARPCVSVPRASGRASACRRPGRAPSRAGAPAASAAAARAGPFSSSSSRSSVPVGSATPQKGQRVATVRSGSPHDRQR